MSDIHRGDKSSGIACVGDAGTRGHGDAETWGYGDAGTRGRGDTETRRKFLPHPPVGEFRLRGNRAKSRFNYRFGYAVIERSRTTLFLTLPT
ncbi:MAG: hypothetical protein KME21_31890 [Desmonostoc vinosum HA7617-LM4]|nr:hypothetical protein [Desmonostoc vinosum HA7617-LM4]